MENAIRYTRPGDTIEPYGTRGLDGWISLGVSDSGPGFSAGTRQAVLAGAQAPISRERRDRQRVRIDESGFSCGTGQPVGPVR